MPFNQGQMYGFFLQLGMGYGVSEGIGFEVKLSGNRPRNSKNLWGMRGYGF
jgi:hypothetical protein